MRRGPSLKARDKFKKATIIGVTVAALTVGTFFGAKALSNVNFNNNQQQQQQNAVENYVEIHGDNNEVYINTDGNGTTVTTQTTTTTTPTTTNPTQPAPTDPAPTDPTPTDPAPTDPEKEVIVIDINKIVTPDLGSGAPELGN